MCRSRVHILSHFHSGTFDLFQMGYGIILLLLIVPIHTAPVDYYGPEYDNVPEIELMDGEISALARMI